jgi:beta-lactamase class A
MTRRAAVIAALSLAPSFADTLPAQSLRAELERRIAAVSGATVGVFVLNLAQPETLALGADLRFHAASTMKVAVMVQVFRDIDAGRLRLRQPVPVTATFRSLIGDSAYTLSMADDSDSSLYRRVGQTASVAQLVELMITVSSNLATNVLIDLVGAARVQQTLRELGVDSMTVLRGVEDGPAYRAGLNNTTTARALGQLLAAIADGRAASAPSCGAMLRVLLRQRFGDAIPAGLPRGTRVAHKTGWITALHHDAGIVYVRNRPHYVIALLTRGIPEASRSAALMAELAGLIHASILAAPAPR